MKRVLCVIPILMSLVMVRGASGQAALKDLPVVSGKWWTNRRVIRELNLAPDQQARIDAVWNQTRRNLIDRRAALDRRQLDLSEILSKDVIDEAAALQAFDRVQEARATLERATFLMRIQIKNLLSAGQQQKLEAIAERLGRQRPNNAGAPAAERPIVKK
jgi:Spy/CpxP family protein refolding chaperone